MTFIQENAYLILLHGCSLVEDFNNFRLCCSAASHANTKLPPAKYMAVADPAKGAAPPLSQGLDDRPPPPTSKKASNQLSLADSESEKNK